MRAIKSYFVMRFSHARCAASIGGARVARARPTVRAVGASARDARRSDGARRAASRERARQKMMGDFARDVRATTHERGKMTASATAGARGRVYKHLSLGLIQFNDEFTYKTRPLMTNLRIKPNPNSALDAASRGVGVGVTGRRAIRRRRHYAHVAATRRRATRWCAPRARAPRD